MLHQPTKYHTNPLTHFLNLHTTTMTTNSSSSSSPAPTNQIRNMLLNTNEQQELDQLQQDGHPDDKNNQQLNNDLDVDDNLNNNNSNTPSELNEQNMGKSFTIAAILGLKNKVTLNSDDSGETGIGCGGLSGVPGHELHDVMNLSINQNNIGHNKYLNNYDSDSSNNNNNNNSNNNNHNRLITNRLSSLQHFHQTNFNYHSHHPHHHQQQQQPQQQQQQPSQQQPQINNNTSAINASSALQSLQQLHHQHSHTINTVAGGFHLREKNKNEQNLNKKTSLKNKRVRTIFTPEQLERLEAEFERQQYMVGPERLYLAHTLQLTEAQVKVWFQNRRIKWRKHHLEITQQRLALIRQRQINTVNSSSLAHQQQQQQAQNQQNRLSGGSLLIPLPDVSPELTICSDSMDVRSISETDD